MEARYVRVSTPSQNTERQLKEKHPNEYLYIDICSGATPFKERPKGLKLLEDTKAKKINYISVAAVDRLGRNTLDVLNTLQFFEDNKTVIKIDNLGVESLIKNKPNPTFKIITSVMATLADLERQNIRERTLQGVAIAKAKGKYKGRVRGSKEDKKEFLAKYPHIIKELKTGLSLRKTAKLHGVSLGTVQKVKGYL